MDRIDRVALALDPEEIGVRRRFEPGRAGFENLSMLVGLARELIHPQGARDIAPCAEHSDLDHLDLFTVLPAEPKRGSLPEASRGQRE